MSSAQSRVIKQSSTDPVAVKGTLLVLPKNGESVPSFSPRERDLLHAVWNGKDSWQAAQDLGISRAAFWIIMSKEHFQKALKKYFDIALMSQEESRARRSEQARKIPSELTLM